jgi:hypothetical protein
VGFVFWGWLAAGLLIGSHAVNNEAARSHQQYQSDHVTRVLHFWLLVVVCWLLIGLPGRWRGDDLAHLLTPLVRGRSSTR